MGLRNETALIAILLALAGFLFFVGLLALIYEYGNRNSRYKKENTSDWLFYHFNNRIYSAIYGHKDAYEVAGRLGINVKDYYRNCILTKTEPEPVKMVVEYLYGCGMLFISVIFTAFFSPVFLLLGVLSFAFLTQKNTSKVKKKATAMRLKVENELPSFLELLATALDVGLDIDTAIEVLSLRRDTLLAKEFLTTLNDVKLGAAGWQIALEKVAEKYELDTLSDFVLDVTVAYNKGISVANSVERKAKDIKYRHYLNVKERAGKTENTILIPIALLQFVPMITFVLLPTLVQLRGL